MLALAAGVVGACSSGEAEDAPRAPEVRLRLDYEVGDTLHYRHRVWGTVTRADTTGGKPPTESYERVGDVVGVVFPCGWVLGPDGDELRVYYGAADTSVCVAVGSMRRILDYLHGVPPGNGVEVRHPG